VALLRTRFLAERLLVRLVLAKGVMRELQVRAELPIDEDRRAEACAECDDHLHAVAVHGGEPLDIGIILDADWYTKPITERARKVESVKSLGAEIGCRANDSIANDARKAD